MRVLDEGGNAVDAAVTATFVLCVVEPQSTGLGGDCFALISKRGQTPPIAFNGSGRAPAALKPSTFDSSKAPHLAETDVHTVTVPGLVEGLARLLADHGTFTLSRAVAPAVRYAEEGFPVHQKVAFDWRGAASKLAANAGARELFLPEGKVPDPGDVIRLPALARTLRAIAEHGPAAFYEGAAAASIVATLRALGGYHQRSDFVRHRGSYVEALRGGYGAWDVWQVPPNGQGATTLLLLSILEAVSFGAEHPETARYHDLLAVATRLATAERDRRIGDPEHGAIDLSPFLDKSHAAALAAQANRAEPMRARRAAGRGDTAYVSVVDEDRNCVSLISSLFENFGAGIADAESGVILHCRGAGFRLQPGHPNSIAPGKRPLHTIIPGMVSQAGKVVLSFGVTGGHFQPVGQSRIISALFDRGLDLQAAIDEPRSFHRDGALALEPALQGLAAELDAAGHRAVVADAAIGGAHGVAIDWDSGVLTGASDARKDGVALAA